MPFQSRCLAWLTVCQWSHPCFCRFVGDVTAAGLALFLVGTAPRVTTVTVLMAATVILPAPIHELTGKHGAYRRHQAVGDQ